MTDASNGGSVIIVEGGPKAMRRMERFMNVRMKWKGEGLDEISPSARGDDEDDEVEEAGAVRTFNPDNYCTHTWTGMEVQRKYTGFAFVEEEGADACRRFLDLNKRNHGLHWDAITGGGAVANAGANDGWADSDEDEDAMQE